MRIKSHLLNILLLSLLTACSATSSETNSGKQQTKTTAPNFILMIGDDMAVETLSCYQIGNNNATTPNLDQLCDSGVRFDNFWSQPVCSPTRATVLTGQYGFTNGVGGPATGISNVDWALPTSIPNTGVAAQSNRNRMSASASTVNPALKPDAVTFVQTLQKNGVQNYQTAAVGKWHLANNDNGALDHPKRVGFEHYAGSMRSGGVSTFSSWSKVIDGSQPFVKTGYATTDTIDDGISWLNMRDTQKPWLLWVAFNAPHTPFHMPPRHLLNSDAKNLADSGESNLAYYQAMIEAMDTEIGRLLNSLDAETRANTYIIFMGDNGTPGQTVTAPFSRGKAKGSVYQGGVNVPLIIAGPGILAGKNTTSLANSVDLFATIIELTGIPLEDAKPKGQPFDSVSLTPILHNDVNTVVRDYAYADVFGTTRAGAVNSRTIRNTEYKLIQHLLDGSEELYNLENDPYENINLLKATLSASDKENFAELQKVIAALIEK